MLHLTIMVIGQNEICSESIISNSDANQFIPIDAETIHPTTLIKIYIHVYQNNQGGGVDLDQIHESITSLNNYFNFGTGSFEFFFNECEIRHITNNALFDTYCLDLLFGKYNHLDGIDVHLRGDNSKFANVSNGIIADEIVISGSRDGIPARLSSVFPHEIGHALGLYHTHYGTCSYNNGTDLCGNPTPSSLSHDCQKGDYVVDTNPDDPSSTSCNSYPSECIIDYGTGVNLGCTGIDFSSPPTDNIMSYYDESCSQNFTPGQISRMRALTLERVIHSKNEGCCYEQPDCHIINDVIWDFEQNFGGDLYITNGATLTITKNTNFYKDKTVFIEEGSKLIIEDGVTLGPCDESFLWRGIKIEGNGTLDYDNGLHANNATIYKARTGVSQHYGTFGGYMSLNGVEFLDCKRGIELMKYDGDGELEIVDCTFTNGKYGITSWANDFTATSCIFNNIYERGIYGIASSPNINNDNNVSEANFEDCNIGILLAFPSGQTSETTIENNYFLQNGTAIVLESGAGASNSDRSIIRQNKFDVNWVGVKVSGANLYELSNNEFDISFFGNYIDAAGSDPNEIFLNSYNDAIVGPLFTVDNSSTNIERNCFSNHTFFDMFVDGIFKDQGTDETANGNCFSITNPEIGTSDVGPGFDYFQLNENNTTIDDCTLVESEGNFTILKSDESKLSDDCGNTYFPTPNGVAQGHSPCNPNRNILDIEEANEYLISLIEEIEISTILDEDQKEDLIKYYERCLRKNKLLLASILIEEDRIDEAVDLYRNEEEFDMQIKGYSILVDQNRLTESQTYLDRLIASSEEEQDFVFAQGLYLEALMNENYIPTNNNLNQLHDNGHKNTVLAGFSRSVYLYFTDELIEIPIEFEELPNIDRRNSQHGLDEKTVNDITIYPNPFQGNTVSVDYQSSSNTKSSYVLTSLEGKKIAHGLLQNGTNQIEIQSQITGLLFLQITDEIGNVEIHKLIKTK